MSYIKQRSIATNGQELILEEAYKKQEDEYKKSDWDEEYYKLNLVWLQDNFSISRRLPEIKKIGKVVYKDKMTMGKSKYNNRSK